LRNKYYPAKLGFINPRQQKQKWERAYLALRSRSILDYCGSKSEIRDPEDRLAREHGCETSSGEMQYGLQNDPGVILNSKVEPSMIQPSK